MAKSIKAFAMHDLFVTNTKMAEHRFGELSTDSRTSKGTLDYTRTKKTSQSLWLYSETP